MRHNQMYRSAGLTFAMSLAAAVILAGTASPARSERSRLAEATAATQPASDTGSTFAMIGAPRAFSKAPGVRETVYRLRRGPSRFDQIALHRFARSLVTRSDPPVVLYLPGTWMNGSAAPADPRYSLALFMAVHDVDFWALDYRTHFIPPETPQNDLAELRTWTDDLFESDIEAASNFVSAQTGRRRIVVAGFSRGVPYAYRYAAQRPDRIAGLLLFDGFAGRGRAGAPAPGEYAEDVSGKHLTWEKRTALLRLVIANPRAPAPIPGYRDAADNLDHVLYSSAAFGGNGGLANPLGGFSSAPMLAALLLSFDRYFPAIQDYEDALTPAFNAALARTKFPVLAFSSTNISADWPARVATSAASTGSRDVIVRRLERWGHLDIICGTRAEHEVFVPALEWLRQHRR
jgi:pimeloyl-ACP methyl ester carboxylesterase